MGERTKKARLDQLLVARGLAADVSTAMRLIMAGEVIVEHHDAIVLTPGLMLQADAGVQLAERPRYVSRGGYKLEFALRRFHVNVTGRVALDIGASTGGFTDCLLQHGATRVYAVDSGRGQLHNRLLLDSRVVSMERTNARNGVALPEPVELLVADVSFISLLAVLPACIGNLRPGGVCIALFKPQFEAARREVGEGGVISDDGTVARVLARFVQKAPQAGLEVRRIARSPMLGDRGNREFLVLLMPAR